ANAISSLASADGALPSALPPGPMIDLFGRAVAPVSRSAKRESVKVQPTNGTYGRIGSTSSESERLQSSLANRLRGRLGIAGSTPWPMIWGGKVPPLGGRYCRLALSARLISVTDCGLLPTPTAKLGGYNLGGGSGRVGKMRPSLKHMARHNLWPTPTATDARGRIYTYDQGNKDKPRLSLAAMAQHPPPPHPATDTPP